jgi:hypothetical protein
MYEHKHHRLLSRREFGLRVVRHFCYALIVVTVALGAGIAGYHFIGRLTWIDALLNASMILGGMGPVNTLSSAPAKIFASTYALFSGLAFIGIASVMVAPFAHRLLHKFHADTDEQPRSSLKRGRASRDVRGTRKPNLRAVARRSTAL